MERRTNLKKRTDGVSPVVGVMLMLVVTIIIAAVVATFASGLVTEQVKAPTIVVDTQILSEETDHYYAYGSFKMEIVSTSEPIPSKDLKLITKWTNKSGITGGNSTIAGTVNTNYSTYSYNSPLGFGTGVSGTVNTSGSYPTTQWFGNYSLQAGTTLQNNGAGVGWDATAGRYTSHQAGDALDAILGDTWSDSLTKGDVITVRLLHIPSNSVIYSDNVVMG